MTMRVLLVQSETESIGVLSHFLLERGDEVWHTRNVHEALSLTDLVNPHLLILDLHFPGHEWQEVLQQAKTNNPDLKIIVTNKKPDLQRELLAQSLGVKVFLRQPYTKKWVERALARAENHTGQTVHKSVPNFVRIPLVFKLFWPYFLLSVLVLVGLVTLTFYYLRDLNQEQIQAGLLEEKSTLQHLALKEEQALYLTAAALAGIEGIPAAVQAGDSESLSGLLLNERPPGDYEALEFLEDDGNMILSMRQIPWREPRQFEFFSGDNYLQSHEIVKRILLQGYAGQDFALSGLIQAPWGDFYYVGLPVYHEGAFQGIILAGKSMYTIHSQLEDVLVSGLNVYDVNGNPILGGFPAGNSGLVMPYSQVRNILNGSLQENQAREFVVKDQKYLELFVPWWAVQGDDAVLMGIVRSYDRAITVRSPFPFWIALIFIASAGFVFLIAWLISRRILRVVDDHGRVANEVAQGNLQIKLVGDRGDELDNLARHMNAMVSGIQERLLEHDLRGISYAFDPETPLNALPVNSLHLGGKVFPITVLRLQPACFEKMVDEVGARQAFQTINTLYQTLVEGIIDMEGVVAHFDGEALLLYFDLLPGAADLTQTALKACRTAKKMREMMPDYNEFRNEKNLPEVYFSACIDRRVQAAGIIQVGDRLHYAVAGEMMDPIEELQVCQEKTRENLILVSEAILDSLGEPRDEFEFSLVEPRNAKQEVSLPNIYRMD